LQVREEEVQHGVPFVVGDIDIGAKVNEASEESLLIFSERPHAARRRVRPFGSLNSRRNPGREGKKGYRGARLVYDIVDNDRFIVQDKIRVRAFLEKKARQLK
jgi:hypothetical protein